MKILTMIMLSVFMFGHTWSALSQDHDIFAPPTYEERAAQQAVFDDFASRHRVLKVYPSGNEGKASASIVFDIEGGLTCITGTINGVQCSVSHRLNGYVYRENKNGQLVRREYIAPYTNRPYAPKKQCVHQTRYLSYYAECP